MFEAIALFLLFRSALLERLEEGQELVRWPIPGPSSWEWVRFGERFFLQFKAGVEVYLSGVH